MSILIERDIPMPPRGGGKPTSEERLALLLMKVGESFEVPQERLRNLWVTTASVRKTSDRKFKCRGARVWRIA